MLEGVKAKRQRVKMWRQVNALLAFRSANVDVIGTAFTNWNISERSQHQPFFHCKWTGVTCREGSFDVVSLRLTGATGDKILVWGDPAFSRAPLSPSAKPSLVPQMQHLTALTELDVSYNGALATGYGAGRVQGMTGPVPSELGTLTGLERLNLQYNSFNGSIPEFLINLTRLTVLGISYNRFSGPVPEGFWGVHQTAQLTSLELKGLNVTGSLPSSFSPLTSLRLLWISDVAISDSFPMSLSLLRKLELLYISNVNLTGSFPPAKWWAGLSSLTNLLLDRVPLTGQLPLSFPPSLSYLTIHGTQMSGGIPEPLITSLCGRRCIDGTTSCTDGLPLSLALVSNPLGGRFPSGLAQCPPLVWLELSNSGMEGPVPAEFFRNLGQGIQVLNLAGNSFTGTIPSTLLSQTPAMWQFNVSGNRFFGLPPSLRYWSGGAVGSERFSYDIHGNQFMGDVGQVLMGSEGRGWVVQADLSFNNISGSLPVNWAMGLRSLNIEGNSIRGPVPEANSSDCQELVSFRAAHNRLADPLPLGLRCPFLSVFDVSHNMGVKALPVPQRCSLQVLKASSCNISGPIPPGFVKQCAGMEVLDLSSNSISGHLAASGGSQYLNLRLSRNKIESFSKDLLLHAVNVDLSYNRLTAIPLDIAVGPKLVTVNFSHNSITGSIPSNLFLLTAMSNLDFSHNRLSAVQQSTQNATIPGNLYLSHNAFAGAFPAVLLDLPLLKLLDLSSNRISGPLPSDFSSLQSLATLCLANNSFTGTIPNDSSFQRLLSLDLSTNELSGSIPRLLLAWTGSESPQASINLSNNRLSGPVPGADCGILSTEAVVLSQNPLLCGGGGYPPCPCTGDWCWCGSDCQPPCPQPPPAGDSRELTILATALSSVVLLALLGGALALWMHRRRDEWSSAVLLKFSVEDGPLTVRQLVLATGNFSEEHALGRGGFGTVYRATLPNGAEVAIKRLAPGSSQGEKEFKAEMEALGKIAHRNVVKLLAAVVAPPPKNEHLLVYPFLQGGALDSILSSSMPPDSPFRQFSVRHSIALDVARGLKYLHCGCKPGLIHRDMKPANILLDDRLNAHITDFGLSKDAALERSHLTGKDVCGTVGFVAPEYVVLGRMSFKSDVYAYGVTLVQLMSGRNVAGGEVVEKGLQRWAREGMEIIDQRLKLGDENENKMALAAVKVGILCLARVPVDRPTMGDVVRMLENLNDFASSSQEVPPDDHSGDTL